MILIYILAIDGSTKSSGFAYYNDTNLEKFWSVQSSSPNKLTRICKMVDSLDKFLQENQVDKIVMEEVRPEGKANNLIVWKALTYLQAAFECLIYKKYNKIQIEYVVPSHWRKICQIKTGQTKREELKKQDISFVEKKFNVEVKNDDEADAIAIGYAYIQENGEINWD